MRLGIVIEQDPARAASAAKGVVLAFDDAELFLYAGDQHYFADPALPSYDAHAAKLLLHRVLDLLDRVG